MSDPLWPCGLQPARFPCPSLFAGVCSNSCPLIWLCHPTIVSSVAPFSCFQSFPSSGPFPVSLHIRWPKYWSFSISPSNEYSGLISLRIDLFGLLAVQGTLKSLLQHHNLKASIFWCSVFFVVQLSHLCMTTGKNHRFDHTDLCWQSDVSAFNMLSRFVITFLPRRKCFLILWLQSPSTVILEPKKIVCHCFHIYLP